MQGEEHPARNPLGARLYPDMLPLSKQIQLVCDFAAKSCARLTHGEVPTTPDTEKSFEELRQRLARTSDYVKTFKPTQFDGADQRDVTFPAGPDRSITLKGQQFLNNFAFPNFYFHAATAHGILRHMAWKSANGIFSASASGHFERARRIPEGAAIMGVHAARPRNPNG